MGSGVLSITIVPCVFHPTQKLHYDLPCTEVIRDAICNPRLDVQTVQRGSKEAWKCPP